SSSDPSATDESAGSPNEGGAGGTPEGTAGNGPGGAANADATGGTSAMGGASARGGAGGSGGASQGGSAGASGGGAGSSVGGAGGSTTPEHHVGACNALAAPGTWESVTPAELDPQNWCVPGGACTQGQKGTYGTNAFVLDPNNSGTVYLGTSSLGI